MTTTETKAPESREEIRPGQVWESRSGDRVVIKQVKGDLVKFRANQLLKARFLNGGQS